jgi:hypothetical protein
MNQKNCNKPAETIDALIDELLKYRGAEGDEAQKNVEAILQKLEKYLSKEQIEALLKRLSTMITGSRLTEREKAELLGNLPPV